MASCSACCSLVPSCADRDSKAGVVVELVLLALALSADAFAVALVRGAAGEHSLARALETGLAFGLAQALMPLLGWGAGVALAGWIEAIDHWIAFVLLAGLGLRMLYAAFSGTGEDGATGQADPGSLLGLFAAAVATSIDAAAAGLTLDLFGLPVWQSCLIIGVVTALVCVPGYWFASRIGGRLGRIAEAGGGVMLVGLGAKILLEHLAH